MKNLLIAFFAFCVCASLNLQAQGWEQTYSFTPNGDFGLEIVPTQDGNYVGVSIKTFVSEEEPSFITLFKIDEEGNKLWEYTYSWSVDIHLRDILEANDGSIYLLGDFSNLTTSGNIFFAKVDSDGQLEWEYLGDEGAYLNSSIFEGENNHIFFISNIRLGAPSTRIFEVGTDGEIIQKIIVPNYDRIEILSNEEGRFQFYGNHFDSETNIAVLGEFDENFNVVESEEFIVDTGEFETFRPVFLNAEEYFVYIYSFPTVPIDETTPARLARVSTQNGVIWSKDIIAMQGRPYMLFNQDSSAILLGGLYELRLYDMENGTEINRNTFEWYNENTFGFGDYITSHESGFLGIGVLFDNFNFPSNFETLIIKTNALGDTYTNNISGHLSFDENEDCLYDNQELGLEGWVLELIQLGADTTFITTDEEGYFSYNVGQGEYELRYYPNDDYWIPCQTEYAFEFTQPYDSVVTNFSQQAPEECYFLTVDVGTAGIIAFGQSIYHIDYCNLGPYTVDNPVIELRFDAHLLVDSFSIPHDGQDGNTFFFELDPLDYNDCGSFIAYLHLDPDSTVIGSAHCVEAHILPDSICNVDPDWSGASIEVSVDCQGDSVSFNIENIGTGDMISERNYFVVEDHVILGSGNYQLEAGQVKIVTFPSDGSTYWMQASQELGHPGQSNPNIWIEGCGAENPFSIVTGIATEYPEDDADPFVSIDCRAVKAVYEPTGKEASPKGISQGHYIEPAVDIEYMIRFQNVGADSVMEFAILDTLSEFLNPSTVQAGASSHPYSFNILDDGVLSIRFDDTYLTDMFTNPDASKGFVKFKVDIREEAPLGSIIYNEATVYFDVNPPVNTNKTWHTIGEYFTFIPNPIDEDLEEAKHARIYPNPFFEQTNVYLPALDGRALMNIVSIEGRRVYSQQFDTSTFTLDLRHLPGGIYFYSIYDESTVISTGKLVIQK